MYNNPTRNDYLILGLLIVLMILLLVATFWFIVPSWTTTIEQSATYTYEQFQKDIESGGLRVD